MYAYIEEDIDSNLVGVRIINTQSLVHVIMFRHCRHTDLFAVAVVYRHTVQQRTGRSCASAAIASASATFPCGRRVGSLRCRTVSLDVLAIRFAQLQNLVRKKGVILIHVLKHLTHLNG